MGSTNERRRYYVTPSLIGRAHTQNDPCKHTEAWKKWPTFFRPEPLLIQIFVAKYHHYATMVKVLAWHWTGDKPLLESVMINSRSQKELNPWLLGHLKEIFRKSFLR